MVGLADVCIIVGNHKPTLTDEVCRGDEGEPVHLYLTLEPIQWTHTSPQSGDLHFSSDRGIHTSPQSGGHFLLERNPVDLERDPTYLERDPAYL